MTNIKNLIVDFTNKVVCKKTYWMSQLFLATIGYGFSLFNRTVSVDDMAYERYDRFASGVNWRCGRWGCTVLKKVLSPYEFSPFILHFLYLCTLVLSAILICTLFYIINGRKESVVLYTVFSGLYITYPLIGEIWPFSTPLYSSLCFAVLTILYLTNNNIFSFRTVVISTLLFFPAAIGYEAVYFFYITMTLIALFLKYTVYGDKGGWMKEGFLYAAPMVLGFFLREIVGK